MLSHEKNALLTRTGPDTPAGRVMRLCWQPAALVEELSDQRPICPVTLLGEALVLFRDGAGRYGLLDRHCPHRGVDLCGGRLEAEGLRCAFHGWLFDVDGRCLDQPAEPIGSQFHQKVRAAHYPCRVHAGIVWAYLGPGEPPSFPELDCFVAPDAYTFAFKGLWECNWMQAMEIGIDPAHASYLHRFFKDEDPAQSYGRQFRDRGAAETDLPMTRLLREFARPTLSVEDTAFGLRVVAVRDAGVHGVHVRVTHQIFPHAICVPMSTDMHITQWHVPIDDTRCYWYAVFTSFGRPVDRDLMRRQRLEQHDLPSYAPKRNKRNNYGFDAAEQRDETYTGLGFDINTHDQWAVESPGPLQDRTKEHLGTSDVAIIRFRRRWEQAIDQVARGDYSLPLRHDGAKPDAYQGPGSIDAILAPDAASADWKAAERARRDGCAWGAGR